MSIATNPNSTRLVSPERLDCVRDLVDLEIVERHLRDNVDCRWACSQIAEELELRLYYCNGPMGLWVAWSDTRDRGVEYPEEHPIVEDFEGNLHPMGELRRPHLLNSHSWLSASEIRCWACSERDALLGACVLAIDSTANIFYDQRDLGRFVPKPVEQQLLAMEQVLTGTYDQALDDFVRNQGGWHADELCVSMSRQVAEYAEWLGKEIQKVIKPVQNQSAMQFQKHQTALLEQKLRVSDLPSSLTEKERSVLRNMFALVMPLRQHLYYTIRATQWVAGLSPFGEDENTIESCQSKSTDSSELG